MPVFEALHKIIVIVMALMALGFTSRDLPFPHARKHRPFCNFYFQEKNSRESREIK
jgi:hypothetical protein